MKKSCYFLLQWLLATTILPSLAIAGVANADTEKTSVSHSAAAPLVKPDFGRLPLYFAKNLGQSDVSFIARAPGYSVGLSATTSLLRLNAGKDHSVVTMSLDGANSGATLAAEDPQTATVNYLQGRDSAKWVTNIPTSARVHAKNVYPGIDVVYYGNQNELEHDFVVAPGASPSLIRWKISGADAVSIAGGGDLKIDLGQRHIGFRKPTIYQVDTSGVRQPVEGEYSLVADNVVGFKVANYDASRELIIDPVLTFSTYLGGSNLDSVESIALGTDKSIYVAGTTYTPDFTPTTNLRSGAPANADVFITKISPLGVLVYTTFIGGNDYDAAHGIAVDSTGAVYVAGETYSTDLPVVTAKQSTYAGAGDGFLLKLNPAGSALVYSTYYGGNGNDVANSVAVNSSFQPVIVGTTFSTDVAPSNLVSPSGFQQALNGGKFSDAFVAKYSANGLAFLFATLIGTDSFDSANDVALDAKGNIYYTGQTTGGVSSITIPSGFVFAQGRAPQFVPYDPGILVGKLNSTGANIVVETINGTKTSLSPGDLAFDEGKAIAVDPAFNVYLVGDTEESQAGAKFPLKNAQQPTIGGQKDGFLIKLDSSLTNILYATYLGGTGDDIARDVALDSDGSVYVAGDTLSANFPLTRQFATLPSLDFRDAFVTKFAVSGLTHIYSVLLGGESIDTGRAIAVDGSQVAYLGGETYSSGFPLVPTPGTLPANAGNSTASSGFVAKISDPRLDLQVTIATTLSPAIDPVTTETSGVVTYSINVTNAIFGGQPVPATNVPVTVKIPKLLSVTQTVPASLSSVAPTTSYPYTTLTFILNRIDPGGMQLIKVVTSAVDAGLVKTEADVINDGVDPLASNNHSETTLTVREQKPTVSISTATSAVDEGGSSLVTITRVGPTTSLLVIPLTYTGTATNGLDYDALPSSQTIPVGASSVTFTIRTIDDTLIEPTETVVATLGATSSYVISPVAGSVSVDIRDNDAPPTVSISTPTTVVDEGGSSVVTITRVGATTNPLIVSLTYTGTATSGLDYAPLQTTQIIPAGASSVTFTVTTIDDTLVEPTETVIATLNTSASYVILSAAGSATVEIRDNDGPTTVSILSSTTVVNEGGSADITINRVGPTTTALVVPLTLTGTATNGVDYNPLPASQTIPVGASSVTFTVKTIDDTLVEPTETIIASLGTSSSYAISPEAGSATVEIRDNDGTPTVSIFSTTTVVNEGGSIDVTITRVGPTTSPLVVPLTYTGTATDGLDYYPLPASQTIPVGESSVTFTVITIDDTIIEGPINETVNIAVVSSSSYNISPAAGEVDLQIRDNDSTPIVSVLRGTEDKVEGANGAIPFSGPELVFVLQRTGSTQNSLQVNIASSGTATSGADYFPFPTSVTIPAGKESVTFGTKSFDDQIIEGSESVIVTATPATGIPAEYTVSTTNGSAEENILDNETVPLVSIDATTAAGSEDGTNIVFTVTRANPTGTAGTLNVLSPITVNYSVSGTATPGSDYVPLSGTVTIPSGSRSAQITVTPIDDTVIEPTETVIVSLAAPSSGLYGIGTAEATGTIADNDTPTTVSAVATDDNASDRGGNTGTIVLTRSGSTKAPLFVKYKLTGSAKNGVDYSRLRNGVTFPAGQSTVSIIISPLRNSGSVVKAILTPLRRTGYSVSGSSATVSIRHYNKIGF